MKSGLVFSALAIIAIIVAASFGLHILPVAPIHNLSDSIANSALYVCPAANHTFDQIARQLSYIRNPITIAFFFILMIWVSMIGWALYQNLLKDKFEEKSWESIIFLGKILFWLMIVGTILLHAPNRYRQVGLKGVAGGWVLCEFNDPASKPVRAAAVIFPE
jgi:uncharacterized membrane protein (DUF485 family)